MIKITVSKKGDEVKKIVIEGHAGYAQEGYDIYCASVSSVYLCCASALDEMSFKHEEKSGYTYLGATKKPSSHDEIVLDVLVKGLEALSKTYPKYIKFKGEKI